MNGKRTAGSWLNRLFGMAVSLYPPDFRKRFGPEMRDAFDDLRDDTAGRPRADRTAAALRAVLGCAVGGIRERFAPERRVLVHVNYGRAGSNGGPPMVLSNWIADVRYAARRLRTRPGYTLVAVLTLALGVGGTAAIYGIARGLLFDALPYADEREVGVFWKKTDWTEEEFLHMRGRAPGFREIALYRSRDAIMRDGDAPARLLPGVSGSAELFDVLGAARVLGRGFRAGDDAEGAEPVAVLSYGLWRELGGGSSIIGSRLTLDGRPHNVIGVMPRGFWFPDPSVRIWTPESLSPETRNWNSTLIGRVAPGQDVRAMEAPVAAVVAMLDERFDYPAQWDKTKGAHIMPIRDDIVGGMSTALYATLGAMALILLIACANVAALMLGQIDARSTELAVRLALGAHRKRLVQQMIVEAVLIACAAGALGAAIAGADSAGCRMHCRLVPGLNRPRRTGPCSLPRWQSHLLPH
jgi:hypothetical protein